MKMKWQLIFFPMPLIFFAGCVAVQENEQNCAAVLVDDVAYCPVSIYSLIVTPEKYDGENVMVIGYLTTGSGNTLVGPALESVRGPVIIEDAVLIDSMAFAPELGKFDQRLVTIYGKFVIYDTQMSLFPRQLKDLAAVDAF